VFCSLGPSPFFRGNGGFIIKDRWHLNFLFEEREFWTGYQDWQDQVMNPVYLFVLRCELSVNLRIVLQNANGMSLISQGQRHDE
jgi:hypothetical protein